MKIVVTGALGHIGSALIRALPDRFTGAEIVMLDNLATLRYPSLFDLPAGGQYQFIETDVRHADLRPVFQGAHSVVHLAATTDAAGSVSNPTATEDNNYNATAKVAAACAETGTRLIHLSSTSVYGTQADTVSEDCPAGDLKPQSPYAESKLKEEKLLRSLHNSGLKAIICRFGTIFGPSPGMRFHTAVNKFCWQAVMRQPLTVWRTAYDQKRPYLDLRDAVCAITHIIERDVFDGRIYNVLTLNATVRNLVEALAKLLPDLKLSFIDNPIMNQLSYEVSAQRFVDSGFIFTGDLQRGIGATVALLRAAQYRA
jgi:UDP-glucose 4-epimerase